MPIHQVMYHTINILLGDIADLPILVSVDRLFGQWGICVRSGFRCCRGSFGYAGEFAVDGSSRALVVVRLGRVFSVTILWKRGAAYVGLLGDSRRRTLRILEAVRR
jgi:hypothetical protein